VSTPFALKPEGHFEGEIRVRYKELDSKAPAKSSKLKAEQITVFLMKKEKVFGDTKRFVWELTLDKVEL